jgi:hypothetical protein
MKGNNGSSEINKSSEIGAARGAVRQVDNSNGAIEVQGTDTLGVSYLKPLGVKLRISSKN